MCAERIPAPGRLPAWRALEAHRPRIAGRHLRDLLASDPGRAGRLSVTACGLRLDYAKHRVDDEALALLRRLAEEVDLPGWRARMLAGDPVNDTEGRAALHVALRRRDPGPFPDSRGDVMPDVRETLARMRDFVARVRDGRWRGFGGEPVRTVVNVGIGGSDLGPAMAAEALEEWRAQGLRAHFVSNLDSTQLAQALAASDPRTTLFVIASKSFTTEETLANARSARAWLLDAAGGDERAIASHFVAVSTALERTSAFGIDPGNVFGFWDWVGGRYSMWSAIGLAVALLVGMDRFEALLAGASEMDAHFRDAPPERNMPVVLGLLGVWCRDFLGAATHAVLPYDWALRSLPAYLQQLEMESNGKRVTRAGEPVEHGTCPVVWGGPGSNGQHAYYQLLHQGTLLVPADFIVPARLQRELPGHAGAVAANAIAQSEALMRGRTAEEARAALAARGLAGEALERLVPHLVLPGNQPSSTILYERLSPRVLGALVALYEHKVFVQSVLWGVNPFDQFGVELGKQLAGVVAKELAGGAPADHDASTRALIDHVRALRSGAG